MADNIALYTGTGRRKEATARVRLIPGTGKVSVNGREAAQYFGRQQLVDNAMAPFRVTDTVGRFDVFANCDGGGINGQSGALRLGIARALLEDAPILVLDEMTSNVDPANEVLMQRAVSALAQNRTVLVVAHHLSTIRSADQIIVMQQGKIVQRGTHEQLLEEGAGYYRTLWEQGAKTEGQA